MTYMQSIWWKEARDRLRWLEITKKQELGLGLSPDQEKELMVLLAVEQIVTKSLDPNMEVKLMVVTCDNPQPQGGGLPK